MAQNYFEEGSVMAPATIAEAVTLNTPFTNGVCRSLYIGGGGDAKVTMSDGTSVAFVGLTAGSILPVRASQVNTGATATNIVALF